MAGQRERRIVERLQERAGNYMRLALATLPRPGMQRQLMLERRLAAGGEIRNARFAERDIRKRRLTWRRVIDLRAAERCNERGVSVHGGTQRRGGGNGHENHRSARCERLSTFWPAVQWLGSRLSSVTIPRQLAPGCTLTKFLRQG